MGSIKGIEVLTGTPGIAPGILSLDAESIPNR
jgi:hypothetical protein